LLVLAVSGAGVTLGMRRSAASVETKS